MSGGPLSPVSSLRLCGVLVLAGFSLVGFPATILIYVARKMLSDFEQELLNVSSQVDEYLDKNQFKDVFCPDEILHSSFHYLELGGKRLRPAVTLFSCGAVGGDPSKALPAAAAVEIWHNFTLAHDDIIDQDEKRRNGDSVHVRWAKEAKADYRWSDSESKHFGLTIGILSGDAQHGWSVAKMLPDLASWFKKIFT